ncbi:MAG: hypothetical protein Q7J85_07150 [Bacillota bacterium]|nr:hypothetical protein [Bacillota bacterium]
MAIEYLDKGNDDGTCLGQSASEKISFYGATPQVQAAFATATVVTTAATNTTPYGFATAGQADAIVTLVNELRAELVALGLVRTA